MKMSKWRERKNQQEQEQAQQHNVLAYSGGRESQISKPIYMESFLLHEAFTNLYFAIVKFRVVYVKVYTPLDDYYMWNDFLLYMSVRVYVCVSQSVFSFVNMRETSMPHGLVCNIVYVCTYVRTYAGTDRPLSVYRECGENAEWNK